MIQCAPMEGSNQVKVIFTLQPDGRDRGAVSDLTATAAPSVTPRAGALIDGPNR